MKKVLELDADLTNVGLGEHCVCHQGLRIRQVDVDKGRYSHEEKPGA